ncbi:hypothetical protein CAC42_4371 [Sphaceloma murrayae]|uniref:DNA-directed DNA polymerase n=1 Tax=Sphaceloma murrayae TaxID=2082308 RepID=A0A2K1QM66_9PEZI|nr:hypothetical protein CAC42_4371 [Sphaceloma murrayae]
MSPGHSSYQTLVHGTSPHHEAVRLDLSNLPPIHVSLTHFERSEVDDWEDRLHQHDANLTYDFDEVRIVLTKVEQKRRAQFDLRSHGLWTKEVPQVAASGPSISDVSTSHKHQTVTPLENASENAKLDDASTQSDSQRTVDCSQESAYQPREKDGHVSYDPVLRFLETSTIKVIKMHWMETCLASGRLEPLHNLLVFEGTRIDPPNDKGPTPLSTPPKRKRGLHDTGADYQLRSPGQGILARAKADAAETSPMRDKDFGSRRFGDKSRSTFTAPYAAGATSSQPPHLLVETTSEHEGEIPDSDLPPPPDWVVEQRLYACQRMTPPNPPNEPFIELLKEIRLARLLTADEIGVRAYSTSIASIAAYPYKLTSPKEVLRLPGCDIKIANLFVEYANTGVLHAAQAAKDDPDLKILRLFYDIWGVGATTARDFYYQRGWRELDDVVEYGWSTLSRVQQIGVKYYDEFKAGIPRSEVEDIARIIHSHAVKVRDSRIQSLVVGGYRRGKDESGDVDIIVSHPDEDATKNLVTDIVSSLEEEGWITHTLLLALTSTHRDQQTLPFRASKERAGTGFDTLDKALVVWQDPRWEAKARDKDRNAGAKNPAPHRRVDIIISPWRTVGCAVMGWSGGTTFQRDVRRYAKNVKGWKFDSSGVRERGSGSVVDVEGFWSGGGAEGADEGRGAVEVDKWKGRSKGMVEAEKRVFRSLGLEWREPDERCTG